jgi:hypothetical protein
VDTVALTAEQCVWFLTITAPYRRTLLKKLSTGEYVLVWDAATHEYILTKVD